MRMSFTKKILDESETGMCLMPQKRAGEDGIACAAMLINHFGKNIKMREFRKENIRFLGKNSFEDITNICQAHGLQVKSFNCHYSELKKLTLPCLVYWRMQRIVVLEKIEKSTYFILDPGNNQIEYREDELEVYFCEFVLMVSQKVFN